jgi:hypothetical protein
MVQERKIPMGGLHRMREIILLDIQDEMAKTIHVVTRKIYRGFCALMFSAFYTLSPQGRIGGLEHLTFNQTDELMVEWDTQSSSFKTGAKFGFQIFSLTSDTEKLFRLYIDKYRPHAAGRARVSSQRSNGMWLNWDGITMPAAQIGKLVTSYWERVAGVKMTTTICRSLVETLSHAAHQEGLISTTERDAIQGVNGHSGAMARDYYLLNDRRKESHSARNGFNAMFGADQGKKSKELSRTPPHDDEDDGEGPDSMGAMFGPERRGRSQHSPKPSRTPPHDDEDDGEGPDSMGAMFRPERRGRSQHSPKPSRTPPYVLKETDYPCKRIRANEPQYADLQNVKRCNVEPIADWNCGEDSSRQQSGHANISNTYGWTQDRKGYGSLLPVRMDAFPHNIIGKDEIFQPDCIRHLLMLMKNEEESARHRKREVHKPIPNDRDLTDPQWGTCHPDFGRQTTRAKFTHIEVQWIGKFCSDLIRENPWMQSRMLVECLHALRLDFDVHKYFHPRHVTDPARLRPGLEAFEKAHGKIV